jgi:UDP-glucose 4-epimerase
MTRILVTGVAGHIGSAVATYALRMGVRARDVVGVDDLSCGYRENVPEGVDFREHDLAVNCDFGSRPFDLVFHCAAYAAECMSPFVRAFNVRSNMQVTTNVLNHVLRTGGCDRFVYFSSMAAYGDARGAKPPFSERHECSPKDPYGAAKLYCELDLAIAAKQHGLRHVVLRPHNVYGPGQSIWQRYRNVLGLWMRAALEGRPATVFGDGEQTRAFSYVDDIVPCVWRAATDPTAIGETVNLGGSRPTTINEAFAACALVTGADRRQVQPARHEVKHAWCTTDLSRSLLGYRDQTSLEEGLRRMWEWARDVWEKFPERRGEHGLPELELTEGVPPSWTAR